MLNERTKPFTVSYHSAANARLDPEEGILERRWLHVVFVITHMPASWPAWGLATSLLVIAAIIMYTWLPFGPVAFTAAAVYLGFALADWLMLIWLPESGRSFGPIGPQLFLLTLPRFGLAVLIGLVGLALGVEEVLTALLLPLILLQLVGTITYAWGTMYEPFALTMTRMTVHSPNLTNDMPPIRLLHLSDLHVERLTRREAHLVELIDQAQPDLIVITGDYLNLSYVDDPVARAEVRRVLAHLDAPYGVYATLGSPPVDPRNTTPTLFDRLKIRLLRDEVAVLTFEDGRTLSLLGLDCEHDLESDGQVFRELVRLSPDNSMRVLLYHSPELMPLVQQYPIELYLCGHTHGGQVRTPFYGAVLTSSALGKRYEMGPYFEQNTTLYISRGIGLEGLSAPRLRLLCPPEIVFFALAGVDTRG